MISGGILGLLPADLGGFLYVGQWLTQLVHDQQAASRAVTDAVHRLADAVERRGAAVATSAGTLAHRPTCRIVAGKAGVRPVRRGEAWRRAGCASRAAPNFPEASGPL